MNHKWAKRRLDVKCLKKLVVDKCIHICVKKTARKGVYVGNSPAVNSIRSEVKRSRQLYAKDSDA